MKPPGKMDNDQGGASGPSSARAKHWIVLIDDDRDIRQAITFALEREGFKVTSFADGRQAIEGTNSRPSLILLDYMMPRMNAVDFFSERLHHPLLAEVPIVLISAYPDLFEGVGSETAGVLHKPIDLDILLEAVHFHCNDSEATDP